MSCHVSHSSVMPYKKYTKNDALDMLQCVAVCCSVLQCFPLSLCCSVLQCVALCCSVLQCVAVRYSALECVGVCCSVLHCVAVCCSVLSYVAVFPIMFVLQCAAVVFIIFLLQCKSSWSNSIQKTHQDHDDNMLSSLSLRAATRCNTLRHAATHVMMCPYLLWGGYD